MADVVFMVVVVAFFGLCVAYVKGCDRIIRSGEETVEGGDGVTR